MQAREKHSSLHTKLAMIVGHQNVSDEDFVLWTYRQDTGPRVSSLPDIVVRPKSTEEVQRILLLANRTQTPVYVRGAATAYTGDCTALEGGILIEMTGMNKLIKVDEDSLSCTVEAGMVFGELMSKLEEKGYQLLVTPDSAFMGTVGGNFSRRAGGTYGSAMYGSQGDCILGCKFVLPTGEAIQTGSECNPFSAGACLRYPYVYDPTGFFIGHYGTLGVVTEITLKINPLPEARVFAGFEFDDFDSAGKAIYAIRRSGLHATVVKYELGLGLETLFPKGAPYAEVEGLCVLEGPEKVVQVEEQMLKDLIKEHGAKYTGSEGGEKWWKTRLLRSSFLFKEGVRVITSWHVPIGKAGYYMKFLSDTIREMMRKYDVKCYVGGLSEGNSACLYAVTMYHEDNPDEHQRALKCGIEMNEDIMLKAGFEPSVGTSWPNATRICMSSYVELIKRVKKALDPNHIMSPGVLGL